MIRRAFPGGMYGEAQPNGAYAVLVPGSHLETHSGPIPRSDILHLRLSPDGTQIAGQAAFGDGQYLHWSNGQWFTSPAGTCYGVSVVAFWPDGRLEVSTPEKRYGSQGIRYIAERVYTGDETYGD